MKKVIEVSVKVPVPPNYISCVLSDGDSQLVPISDFTKEELQKIGESWTEELIKKAKKQ